MALWIPEFRLLYSLNPRTASTSTYNVLRKELGGVTLPDESILDKDGMLVVPKKHSSFREIREWKLLGNAEYASAVRAVTVRNPFDSMYSIWHKKRHQYQSLLDKPDAFIHRIPGFVEDMEYTSNHTFSEWFIRNNKAKAEARGHTYINHKWVDDATFLMRFENLHEDFHSLLHKIGSPTIFDIPRHNVTAGRENDFAAQYTPEARQIGNVVFRSELKSFGYSPLLVEPGPFTRIKRVVMEPFRQVAKTRRRG